MRINYHMLLTYQYENIVEEYPPLNVAAEIAAFSHFKQNNKGKCSNIDVPLLNFPAAFICIGANTIQRNAI